MKLNIICIKLYKGLKNLKKPNVWTFGVLKVFFKTRYFKATRILQHVNIDIMGAIVRKLCYCRENRAIAGFSSSLFDPNSWGFSLDQIAHVGVSPSRKLIGRAIIFEVFLPVKDIPERHQQTDRQTDS